MNPLKYDKEDFKNLKLPDSIKCVGLPARKPDFMLPNWGRPKEDSELPAKPESDDEWRPRKKRPKQWCPPSYCPPKPATPSATVTSAAGPSQEQGQPLTNPSSDGKQKRRQKADKPQEEHRVYSFRKRKKPRQSSVETSQSSTGRLPSLNSSTTVPKRCAVMTCTPSPQDRPHACQRCSAAFVQLRIHMAFYHGEKLQAVCQESFRPGGGGGNHGDGKGREGSKDTARRHVCDVCSKAFTEAGHLKTHVMIPTGHKPFVCDVCSELAFTVACNLKTHKMIHTGERPYKCQLCDSAFIRLDNLQTHIRSVHAVDRPHVCDVCGAAFSQGSKLTDHMRIHTGEKPYKCDDCGKSFNQSSNLKSHQRIHTWQKPYKCDDCEKSFNQSSNLKRHQQIHTAQKHYKCVYCGKSFTDSSNFKRHQLSHTGEKPYKCQHCPAAFTQSGSLKRHVKKRHL